MKPTNKPNLASEAVDDYLNLLLDNDDSLNDEEQPSIKMDDSASQSSNSSLSGSKLYHLDSHPSRALVNESDEPNRHDFERVERLLDDFNRRQTKTDTATSDLTLQSPVIQPPVLDTSPADLETEQLYDDGDNSEQDDNDDESIATPVERIVPENLVVEREDWSQSDFQTLLFEVAGLTLALPLIKLGGIHRIDKDITPLFGKPDWFLGLIPGIDGNINVIDTTRWVMPDRYEQAESKGLDYKFIILLDDTNWGLACSNVKNAISLSPDNIKWRTNKGKRPWLEGMLIEEMCALLDVDSLIKMLDVNYPQ